MSALLKCAAVAVLMLGTPAVQAAIPIYENPGITNPTLYTFTASATGTLTAYYAGSTAGYTEDLGLLVNGVDTGIYGLRNKSSSVGDVINFGSVMAGDALTFFTRIITSGDRWYSTKPLNRDGANHIWSTAYTGGDFGIPAGTLVAFEDLPAGTSDFNYNDEKFVFTNVGSVVSGAPEPAMWALMLGGFGLVGGSLRRQSRIVAG